MKRLLIPLCFLLFVAATCERSVDLGIEEPDPRLVVISNFTSNMEMQVEVTRSRYIEDATPKTYILDATVEIFQGEDFIEQFELVSGPAVPSPFYTSTDFVPEVNVLYNIKVDAPGFDPVMAQSKIPAPIEIGALQVKDLEQKPGTNEGEISYSYTVLLTFFDPAEEKNYYHLNFYQQIHNIQRLEGVITILSSYLEQIDFSPINDNNSSIAFFNGGILFEDGDLNGNAITNTFVLNKTIQSETEQLGQMFVELRSVSEEYYRYYNSLSRQQNSGGPPFSEEVILYNNIENGLGVFAGYNMDIDSIQVIQ